MDNETVQLEENEGQIIMLNAEPYVIEDENAIAVIRTMNEEKKEKFEDDRMVINIVDNYLGHNISRTKVTIEYK